MIVIDASATIALLLNEDASEATINGFDALAEHAVIAPSHWVAEVGNSLVTNIRRKRFDPRRLEDLIFRLEGLGIAVEQPPTFAGMAVIAEMAMMHGLTFYDAGYIVTAQTRQASLFTLDRRMRAAASAIAIDLLPP